MTETRPRRDVAHFETSARRHRHFMIVDYTNIDYFPKSPYFMPRIEVHILGRYLLVDHLENGAELPAFVVQMIYEQYINFRGEENLE